MDDEENVAPRKVVIVWLTYDECTEKHGVNPLGRENVKNKLRRDGQHFVRVWLEDDVIAVKGAKP